jgi:hypothetical protein
MMHIKPFGVAALLAVSALSLAQDKVKIEPNWTKDSNYKVKVKSAFEVAEHKATIDATVSWSGEMGKDGYTVSAHHDQLTVVADDNEVPVPVTDYKAMFNEKSVVSSVEGGLEGTDTTRMFMIGQFLVPGEALAKDAATKWELAKNEKANLGMLKIETTFLGDEKVGKFAVHKFKQVVSENGTEFGTTGTYFVTSDGHLLKADIKFKGLPIPVAGGDAAGTYVVSLVE